MASYLQLQEYYLAAATPLKLGYMKTNVESQSHSETARVEQKESIYYDLTKFNTLIGS